MMPSASMLAMHLIRKRSYIIVFGLIVPYLMTMTLIKTSSSSTHGKQHDQSTEHIPNIAAICLIVSNEENYLDEWLDYHLGIGFDHIFIYDNSNDLGQGWLDRRPRLDGKVTVHPFPGEDKQGRAYQHCGKNYLLGRYRWVGFFDADEYLVLKKHADVTAFLLEYCNEGSISLSWQLHSWNGRVQYSPEPVTKRFQGMYSIDQHVKTISSVNAVDWARVPHPHHTFLKDGYRQLDTKGEEISPMWQNLRFPSDVAVFFHHHCKSHREYIAKRSRGRATMSGAAHIKSRNELVNQAKNKVGFHNTSRNDPLAWNTLKSMHAKYSMYDSPNLHFKQSTNASQDKASNAICTVVSDDEAYVDEWVDFHLALGFTKIYVFDSTEEHWFEQWGDERSQSAPVKVMHFHGNKTDSSFKANVFSKCIEMYQMEHNSMSFLEVNDFIILRDNDGLNSFKTYLQSSANCAHPIGRIIFGNHGKAVYDPLPVTMRFLHRVENEIPSQSVLVVKTKTDSGPILSLDILQKDLTNFFASFRWESTVCPGNPEHPHNDVLVHHYLRSTKECIRERGNVTLCYLEGTVEDQSAWEKLQNLLPEYSNFNGFL